MVFQVIPICFPLFIILPLYHFLPSLQVFPILSLMNSDLPITYKASDLASDWLKLPKNCNSNLNLKQQKEFIHLSGFKLTPLQNYPKQRAIPFNKISLRKLKQQASVTHNHLITDAHTKEQSLRNDSYISGLSRVQPKATNTEITLKGFTFDELRSRTAIFESLSKDHPEKPFDPIPIIKARLFKDKEFGANVFISSTSSTAMASTANNNGALPLPTKESRQDAPDGNTIDQKSTNFRQSVSLFSRLDSPPLYYSTTFIDTFLSITTAYYFLL